MKVFKTDWNNFDDSIINEAINIMANGGVILYPTDTVYGLGANIFNIKAVKKVFEIKKRNPLKPLSVLVSSKEAIKHIANIHLRENTYINNYLPGPYTLILNKTSVVPKVVTGGSQKVGVRVPNCEIACRLASVFPIITTSANLSGEKPLNNPSEILEQLETELDLVIDVGRLENNNPSTIIDLTDQNTVISKR